MSNKLNLYEERVKRIVTTLEHKEPDIVPILGFFETWAIHYAGYKIQDVINDPQKELECFGKVFNDIYFDGSFLSFLSRNINMFKPLGGSAYFYSQDNVTIQHKEYVFMTEDEYPSFIKDPLSYTVNENFPKKYPSLTKPYPENLDCLRESLNSFIKFVMKAQKSIAYAKDVHGMPICVSSIGMAPVDIIMDYYRGFKGIMSDIRRRPKELKEAAEALIPLVMGQITKGQKSLSSFPYVFFPLHIPTFLSPKQFGEIYWPSFKIILDQVKNLGGKAMIYLEGNWEHLYEFVNDIPKDFALVILEKDDIFKAKDKIGNNVAIAGGIPLTMLRYATKDECIKHAKKVIDKCAPGGGFIFTPDQLALAPNDMKPENIIALNEFVHTYGKY